MLKKTSKKIGVFLLSAGIMGMTACGQSPVRNPFEKRAEPTLSELPAIKQKMGEASVVWKKEGKEKSNLYSKIQPFVQKDIIYKADENGLISAMHIRDGREIWTRKLGLNVTAGPVIIDQQLIVAAKQFLVSLDLGTGKELWRRSVSSEIVSVPRGIGSTIVVHALDESVSAISSKSSQLLWNVNHSVPALTLRTKSAPALTEDKVIVGLSSGRVVALNLYSGMIEWEYTLSMSRGRSELQRMVDISADPIVIDDTVYVIGFQGKLAALNVENGLLLWERNLSSHLNMSFDTHALYITDSEHNVWAVDRQTGVTIWKQSQLANRYVTSPSLYHRYLVVADREGYVHWMDNQTGHLLGRVNTGEKVYQAPIAGSNFILVTQQNGTLAKVDL